MKICPLKFNVDMLNSELMKCEKENCAWWDTDTKKCVVHNLGAITEVLWNG